MSRILVVDDEASICWAFRESLADEGHEGDVASSAEQGLQLAGARPPDAVVLDVRLPGQDGLAALAGFRGSGGATPVVIMTAFGDLETAVRAIEGGAFDYLVKPFDLDLAVNTVGRALEARRSRDPDVRRPPGSGPEALVGTSAPMQELFKQIALVAPADVPVLITGESGTGKDLVARAIHRHSGRRDGPYLPICLASLSPNLVEGELFGHVKGSFTGAAQDRKGLLELASGGTVLLDEAGDVPLHLQVKLLRTIEHREINPVGDARPRPTNIRILAATNRSLPQLMQEGQFREDLFFRLGVFRLHIPPLREHVEDIPPLAEHFLRLVQLPAAPPAGLADDVLAELRARPWLGNGRELRNAIEHAAIVARGGPIRVEHLPPPVRLAPGQGSGDEGGNLPAEVARWAGREATARREGDPSLYDRFLAEVEPPLLRAALERCGGNRAATAQLLGIHRETLRQKLTRHGIDQRVGPAPQ